MTSETAKQFTARRPKPFGLPYRVARFRRGAGDALQDAYVRWSSANRAAIEQSGVWLAREVTSAGVRREQYVGPWLPRPVFRQKGSLGPMESRRAAQPRADGAAGAAGAAHAGGTGGYALRGAFDYRRRDSAEVLDLSEANCRQPYRMAVHWVAVLEVRFTPAPERRHCARQVLCHGST
ncbi:hypothetical protein [Streptomyces chryseus]